jgi:hypothetical protein
MTTIIIRMTRGKFPDSIRFLKTCPGPLGVILGIVMVVGEGVMVGVGVSLGSSV